MFYTFNQNNSGGSFELDTARGISHYVIVEADDTLEAEYLAERIGLYFDGIDKGQDCECCGDRWHRPWDDGTEVPSIYEKDVSSGVIPKTKYSMKWMDGPEGYIHYKGGRVVELDY